MRLLNQLILIFMLLTPLLTIAQKSTKASKFSPKMILVKGEGFTMGCTSEDSNCKGFEQPAHSVTLNDFSIGKYEVTQAEYKAVTGKKPSWNKKCSSWPVEKVTWEEAKEFCVNLSEKTGKTFRLPTEAEWEYAARGGAKSQNYKYAGSNDLEKVAFYVDNNEYYSNEVGQKEPNELGLYDMTGNVSEWCSDFYEHQYYSNSSSSNPQGPQDGDEIILRGGGFDSKAIDCQITRRSASSQTTALFYIGFRVVMEP